MGRGGDRQARARGFENAERSEHWEVKFAIARALHDAVQRAGLPCHVAVEGPSIRFSYNRLVEPDALVYCGQELSDDAIELPNPIILVEVASPSTRRIDASLKLTGYFSLPSVHHYLIVDPEGPPVIHHRRQGDGPILTSIVHEGTLTLSPPGIEVAMGEMFAAP